MTQKTKAEKAPKPIKEAVVEQPVEKIVEQAKKPKRLKIIDTVEFPGWIVEKDNLFHPIEYVKTKPKWYDQSKHSVAKVANCD